MTLIGASAPDQLPRFAPGQRTIRPHSDDPTKPSLAGRVNPFYASSYREFCRWW